MIIRTAADQLFQVRDAGLDHAWMGIEVKATGVRMVNTGADRFTAMVTYKPKAKAREILIRKAATTIVQH